VVAFLNKFKNGCKNSISMSTNSTHAFRYVQTLHITVCFILYWCILKRTSLRFVDMTSLEIFVRDLCTNWWRSGLITYCKISGHSLTQLFNNNWSAKWLKNQRRCKAFHSNPDRNRTQTHFQFSSEYISLLSFAEFSILIDSIDTCKIFKFYVLGISTAVRYQYENIKIFWNIRRHLTIIVWFDTIVLRKTDI
jgi:hypothetical protein